MKSLTGSSTSPLGFLRAHCLTSKTSRTTPPTDGMDHNTESGGKDEATVGEAEEE